MSMPNSTTPLNSHYNCYIEEAVVLQMLTAIILHDAKSQSWEVTHHK